LARFAKLVMPAQAGIQDMFAMSFRVVTRKLSNALKKNTL